MSQDASYSWSSMRIYVAALADTSRERYKLVQTCKRYGARSFGGLFAENRDRQALAFELDRVNEAWILSTI